MIKQKSEDGMVAKTTHNQIATWNRLFLANCLDLVVKMYVLQILCTSSMCVTCFVTNVGLRNEITQ